MEIIEIKSTHSLVTSLTDKRPSGAHSYHVNCRQFISAYRSWHKHNAAPWHTLGVMTLGFERIWITETEGEQIAAAIKMASSPVVFD